jgi:purine catabolism regulator
MSSPLEDFDRAATDRAAPLVALALVTSRHEVMLTAREHGNFLRDVLSGRTSAGDAEARASALGLETSGRRLLPVAVLPDGDSDGHELLWSAVWRQAREELRAAGSPVLIGSHADGSAAGVIAAPADGLSRREAVDTVVTIVRDAALRNVGSRDCVTVAAAAIVNDWKDLAVQLERAFRTVREAPRQHDLPWHDATIPDVRRLLSALQHEPALRDFVTQVLGPVVEHDARYAAQLMPTLEAVSAQQWNKAEAARVLGVNRQTLYPRLARIERLLRLDLDAPDARLALDIAVLANSATG